jgi:hypothetical protein
MKDTSKPSFLGTMNAIVIGERHGFEFLDAWARTTADAGLAACLKTVALREAEHAAAFEKRMCELGFSLQEKDNPAFAKNMDLVTSEIPDVQKFEQLGFDKAGGDGEDRLLQILADQTIDPSTAGLMGRYIAEERDSGRLLRAEYERVKRAEPGQTTPDLAALCAEVEALRQAVEALKGAKKRTKKA